MTHKVPEPYSGKNPVPQIATKLTSLVDPEHATEAKVQQLQDQSDKHEEKQTKKRASRLAKGHIMHAIDPITGEELDITNAEEEQDMNRGTNVLNTEFPPLSLSEHHDHVIEVSTNSIFAISAAYILSFLVGHMTSSSRIYASLITLLPPSIFTYILLFRLQTISRNDYEDRLWHSERIRGLKAGSDIDGDGNLKVSDQERTRESAEWVNAVLRGVWPILNPDLFSSVVDLLEDIMQTSVPAFIHSVRISDLGVGRNAGRITAIRSLPDVETRQSIRSKAQRGETASFEAVREVQNSDPSNQDKDTSHPDPGQREELNANHVNLEVSFAYRGLPSGRSAASKAGNIHILVEFFLGIQGMFGFKVPVWVEVTGAIGTARVRLQLISNPPFVKTTMFSLMGLPRITISATPLNKVLPNVMNLPFISGFISSAINTAVAEYVAPKSLTVDLQQLISGNDIKQDTEAIGVLVVHIHRATGLKGMDASGESVDPYVTLMYSRLGKPLYSTRIIKQDRNPVFEETAVLLVDVSTIRLREKLSFQLWDSDRMSMDDMLGIAEFEILDLVRHPSKPIRRVSPLSSPDNRHRPGSVEYTIGYYRKRSPTPSLKTSGSDPGIPEDLRNNLEFKNTQDKKIALNDLEHAISVTPPDPEWPSGILSVQVHDIRDLGVKKQGRERKSLGSMFKEDEKGQDDEGEVEGAEGLPSSYCEISLNDELVYKTRVKPMTSSPIFNAGTERFVRDWRKAHVAVSVKDSRLRESDAILGVVMLKLSEFLVNASELTRFYSLEEGLGYGRIRISLLFRPVDAKLPPNLLGFDTGTLEIRDVAARGDPDFAGDLAKCELRLGITNSDDIEKVSRKTSQKREDGTVVWSPENSVFIPVRQRYGSALVVSFRDTSGITSSKKALAVLWLRDLIDSEQGEVKIALWQAKEGDDSRLKLNYVPPDGNLGYWDSDKEKVQRVGDVVLDIVFKPGISEKHKKLMNVGGSRQREAWEAFNRERDGGLRDSVGMTEEGVDEGKRPRGAHPDAEEALQGPDAGAGPVGENKSMPNGPVNSVEGDSSVAGDSDQHDANTMVSTGDVEDVTLHHHDSSGEGNDEEADANTADGKGGRKRGLVQKFKDWRENERELHRDHRGIMQVKPARTAEWVKNNVEDSMHAVKDHFSMRTRKPDVETEV